METSGDCCSGILWKANALPGAQSIVSMTSETLKGKQIIIEKCHRINQKRWDHTRLKAVLQLLVVFCPGYIDKIFVPKGSTLPHLIVLSISTF